MPVLDVPLLVPALLVLVVAAFEWRSGSRACARIGLGAGTALLLGALKYPGLSAGDVLQNTADGLVYVVAVGRVLALAPVLAGVARVLHSIPR